MACGILSLKNKAFEIRKGFTTSNSPVMSYREIYFALLNNA
jgi:hypothetical protein